MCVWDFFPACGYEIWSWFEAAFEKEKWFLQSKWELLIYIYMMYCISISFIHTIYTYLDPLFGCQISAPGSIFKWLYKGLKFQTLGGYRYIFVYVCGDTCWIYSKGLRGLVGLACFKIWLIFQPAMLVYRSAICLLAGHHSTTYKVGPYQL